MQPTSARDAALQSLQAGDASAAIRRLSAALAEAPEDAELCAYLGVAHGMDGNTAEAVQCLRRATQLDPGSAAFQFNLGKALEQSGRPAEALGAYRRALVLETSHARARAAVHRLESEFSTAPAAAMEGAAGGGEPSLSDPPPGAPAAWTCGCGSANAADFRFCPRCGRAAEEPRPDEAGPETVALETVMGSAAASPAAAGNPGAPTEPEEEVNPVAEAPRRDRRPRWLPWLLIPGLGTPFGFGLALWLSRPAPEVSTVPPAIPAATALPETPPERDPEVRVTPPTPPVPAPAARGLGLTRDQVVELLRRESPCEFYESPLVDGRLRYVGKTADGLTTYELIGPPEDLQAIQLSFTAASEEWLTSGTNGVRIGRVLEEYAPGAAGWALESLAEAIRGGENAEREERSGGRIVKVAWAEALRAATLTLTADPEAPPATASPSGEELPNWVEDRTRIPLERPYRFLPADGEAVVGQLLRYGGGTYTVRRDPDGEILELHERDGWEVEPVDPTPREREWLRAAGEERSRRRQEALQRGDAAGRPLELGRLYRVNTLHGDPVTGTLFSLERDLYHLRTPEGGTVVLRPEETLEVHSLAGGPGN